ncbi:MAG TPA: M90 family metallopeptidase [Rhodanobacteraceae bacterium]|nr:M90 family metallopeptidase [Rhodanobacteraceae bacterium]
MNWRDWLPGAARPLAIDDARWQAAMARCPLARRLRADDRERLRQLAAQFLAHKQFHAIAGVELDAARHLLIAMQASMPVLNPGFRALRGWRGVIVYPGRFKVRRNHHDENTGVVTEHDDVLIGEAWQRGPLVLSWADVQQDLQQPWDGFNVVVHEIAHKLDMLDGPPDGVPPLPRAIDRRAWIDAFQRAYDRLAAGVARGHATAIDPYAAENAGEYFAVVSELHFSQPGVLAAAEPAVAALLDAYYGPSPAP